MIKEETISITEDPLLVDAIVIYKLIRSPEREVLYMPSVEKFNDN